MDVLEWLLDADAAIRWQVLRDLTDAPARAVDSERFCVAGEGLGAKQLARQWPDGGWAVAHPESYRGPPRVPQSTR